MLFEEYRSKNNYYCAFEGDDIICLSHWHTSFEILFVKSGSAIIELKDRSLTINEGECVWVLPYEIHSYKTPKKNSVLISIFSKDYIADFYEQIKNRALIMPVIRFSPEMLDIMRNNKKNRYLLKAALYKLCSDVVSGGISDNNSRFEIDNAVKIMLYLQEHYKEQISLNSLAKELGYSYSYTSSIFRKCFSKSFSDVVNEYRLDEAVRMINADKYTMTEISQHCGFSTIRNFNIVFKKYFKVAPSSYQSDGYVSRIETNKL